MQGGTCTQLSPAQLARTLRVVLEMDPDDLSVLHTLAQMGEQQVPRDVYESSRDGAMRHERLSEYAASGAVLLASGCLTTRYTTGLNNLGPEIHVSEIGKLVLHALDPYIRATELDPKFPSRPIAELARSLPEKHPDRMRLLGYQELADVAKTISEASAETKEGNESEAS